MAKSIPQRMCIGCREMKDKKALIRVVKSPEGQISLDSTGKKPGRGAYVCPDPECLKKARKNRGLERAFKMKLEDAVWAEIEAQIPQAEEQQ